jgi:hypothetical protein
MGPTLSTSHIEEGSAVTASAAAATTTNNIDDENDGDILKGEEGSVCDKQEASSDLDTMKDINANIAHITTSAAPTLAVAATVENRLDHREKSEIKHATAAETTVMVSSAIALPPLPPLHIRPPLPPPPPNDIESFLQWFCAPEQRLVSEQFNSRLKSLFSGVKSTCFV